jgi:hypothetical protein
MSLYLNLDPESSSQCSVPRSLCQSFYYTKDDPHRYQPSTIHLPGFTSVAQDEFKPLAAQKDAIHGYPEWNT